MVITESPEDVPEGFRLNEYVYDDHTRQIMGFSGYFNNIEELKRCLIKNGHTIVLCGEH